jgi:SAM-dependent methyltransferase
MPTAAIMLDRPARTEPIAGPASLFQAEWQTYRKVVEENYFFHHEACATLHRVLVEEVASPFRFLDVACGDASATAPALAGTKVSHYRGIDLSEAALALARQALNALPCPVTLERRDFVNALHDRSLSADVAWIGLSLHHLRTAEKLRTMSDLRLIVGETGKLLIYEPSGPDGDTRTAWLKRWDRQRPAWRALTPEEWRAMRDHSHANDFPETHITWLRLGFEAGFGRARCLYEAPAQLFRLYCFDC